jgi:aminoglycoside phosphotransferase
MGEGCFTVDQTKSFVEMVAAQIRKLHDIPIHDCDLDQRLETKFKKAEENILGGFVLESDFDVENLGRTAAQVFDELIAAGPSSEDLVFTHGDLCLPNIIIRENKVAGFIDFERGGVADRYQDLALFLRSFQFNTVTGMDVRPALCRGYGIADLDQEKLDFYRKLDELF